MIIKRIFYSIIITCCLLACDAIQHPAPENTPSLFPPIEVIPMRVDGYAVHPITGDSITDAYTSNQQKIITGKPVAASPQQLTLAGKPEILSLQGKLQSIKKRTNRQQAMQPKVRSTKLKAVQGGKPIAAATPVPTQQLQQVKQAATIGVRPMRYKDIASYDLKYLNKDQGLPSAYVYDVLQDQRGDMWFATSSGVTKYDGVSLTHFGQNEGFTDHLVFALATDQKGKIWMATYGSGVVSYDGAQFEFFTTKNGLPSDYALTILNDSKDNLWFGMIEGGAIKYDGNSFTYFTQEEGLPSNTVKAIVEDREGNIWFGTFNGLAKYDGRSFMHLNTSEGLPEKTVYALHEDREGNIWIGTLKGIAKFDGTDLTMYSVDEGLAGNRINSITEDEFGNLWFGIYSNGIEKFDGQQFTHFRALEGMPSNVVHSLCLDRTGNIWAATYGGGIVKLNYTSFEHGIIKEGSTLNIIKSIVQTENGDLWMGTYGSGIVKYDGVEFIGHNRDMSYGDIPILGAFEDHEANIWFGTLNRGVCKYDGKVFSYYTTENGLIHNTVRTVLQDDQGQLWFGAYYGISVFDGKRFKNFTDANGLSNNSINVLAKDQAGNIWIGSKGGISKYDGQSFTHYTEQNGLPSNEVQTMAIDSNNHLWIGTNDRGLVKFDGVNFQVFTTRHGLPSNAIKSVVISQVNQVWVATDNGLAYVRLADDGVYTIQDFSKQDGLKGLDFQVNSACLGKDNQLYLGTSEGLTQLDLNVFTPAQHKPVTKLRSVDLMGEPIDYRNIPEDIATVISFKDVPAFYNYPQKLSLPYDYNHLTFHFSAIDWKAPHQLQYSYRIKELEASWSQPAEVPFADYRNLPHGDYTFEVFAIGASKVRGEIMAYRFRILPPWWHTWWARGAYVLFAFLGVFAYVRWRTAYLKQRQKVLAQKVKERTAEVVVQKQEAERQRDMVKEKSNELREAYEELQVTNEELQQTQEEIAAQRDVLELNNQELSKYKTHISQSIESALLIQNATLPAEKLFRQTFDDHFILYLPKDVVSGDFYWLHTVGNQTIFILGDCTGHGVSGAFMTMIGNSILDQIVRIDGELSPVGIMEKMHQRLQVLLHQRERNGYNGMDMSVAVIEEKGDQVQLTFGASKQKMYFMVQDELHIIKGSRTSIGGAFEQKLGFEEHQLTIPKGTVIYLFSDGYIDQNLDESRKRIGSKRFRELITTIQSLSLADQKAHLMNHLSFDRNQVEQRDDITVVGLQL
ncbi:MAG: two-component regulator propeller domain-containing protein [Flammeovirgaceae bacterium]